MNINDTATYSYTYRPYEYGWMVYHLEDGVQVMDMCFANEFCAKDYALSLNMREYKRVEDAKNRLEFAKSRIVLHDTPYYSITGYCGD